MGGHRQTKPILSLVSSQRPTPFAPFAIGERAAVLGLLRAHYPWVADSAASAIMTKWDALWGGRLAVFQQLKAARKTPGLTLADLSVPTYEAK
jgi:hypothetical protein